MYSLRLFLVLFALFSAYTLTRASRRYPKRCTFCVLRNGPFYTQKIRHFEYSLSGRS